MKILIAIDSLKGSLSSLRAGLLLEKGIRQSFPNANLTVVPVADGGEGSLEMIDSDHKLAKNIITVDPLGRRINSRFLISGDSAFFELAQTSGLPLLKKSERNPLLTNTLGLGLEMKAALEAGIRKMVVFAGGSATNDAGLGALYGLGFQFFDSKGNPVIPVGGNLNQISDFQRPAFLPEFEVKVATDVNNPFDGPNGAAMVFAPQKGADKPMIEKLEIGLKNIASLFPGKDINAVPGAGAAGGLAGGFHLFLDAKVVSGTQLLFAESGLNQKISDACIVITGEGKIDEQSMSGKLVSAIIEQSKKVILVAGRIETNLSHFNKVLAQFVLQEKGMTEAESMENAERLMVEAGKKTGDFLKKNLGITKFNV